jgi:phosphoribosyl-ATP pyrophosphohydrolase/phosphoribosyl-AMP cyclohydrolase
MESLSPESPTLRFDPVSGLAPAVIQDASTGQVLMLGYLNDQAWARTQEEVVDQGRKQRQLLVGG